MARRNRKAVDYSQFGDADDDDDDKDFASIAAPLNKKSKRLRTETKKKEQQNKLLRGDAELQKGAANKRVSLDDKLYQRDLEVALELSVSEPALGTCKVKDSQEQVLHETANERNQTVKDFGQRTAGSQQKVLTESQHSGSSLHSYDPETASISAEESEANSSFSEDSHDEFPVKKATKENGKRRKKLNTKNNKAKTTTKLKMSSEAKPEPALKRTPRSSESMGNPLKTSSPTAPKRPCWTPPATSGSSSSPLGGVLVKSPTQSLRLGLSRLARVKPLHPSTASV